jgi:CHAD domain-containing protein
MPRRYDRSVETAADLVRRVLATHVHGFLVAADQVSRDEPDAVHQLRVRARTLRSVLRTFGPLVDRPWADELRAELKWGADLWGAVRDAEVQRARLEGDVGRLAEDDREPALRVITEGLGERRETARLAALAELSGERWSRLVASLADAAAAPRLTVEAQEPAVEVLPGRVHRASRRLVRAVKGLEPDGPAAEWHRVRILAKRARYAAEAAAEALGAAAAEGQAEALEKVTDLLGDLHDAAVARRTLRTLAAHPGADGPTGYALGLLDAVEAERAQQDRAAFAELWPEVKRVVRRRPDPERSRA